MSLKLFRSTGYSSILSAGETRLPMHPGWLIVATSVWVGFACNAALWQQLRSPVPDSSGLAHVLTLGTFAAAACGLVLSVLGWRKTLKPAATAILFLSALWVCAIWGQATPPLDSPTALPPVPRLALPSWDGLLRWQAWATLAGLALGPAFWVSRTKVRRLPGQQQLGVNVTGILVAGALLALTGFFMFNL